MDNEGRSDDDSQQTKGTKVLKFLKNNLLILCLLLAMGLGIGLGAALRTVEPPMSDRSIMYLRFPGDILMNMLTFLIVPLIISSLVSGLASLDTRASGMMGLRAVVYYFCTTFAAVVLGIILSISIKPGTRGSSSDEGPPENVEGVVNTVDTFLDLVRQCFPNNIVEMCFTKPVTEQVLKPDGTDNPNSTTDPVTVSMLVTQQPVNSTAADKVYEPVLTKADGPNVLGMVVFSIFFGVILGRMGERGKPLMDVFESLCDITMQLVKLVIWYSPIGILCLIAAKVVEMEDPETVFKQLVFYFLTVMLGLGIHGLLVLPLIYFLCVRKNPFSYLYGVLEAMVTALATSSSSATMPVTMRCLEEKNGVDSRIVKFVIPVGATINMDGTALYEAVAVLFIGQLRGFDLNIGRIITISVTATAAAVGAAGVPQAGLVTMVIVLSAVGFPTEDVALILAVDWLLDRFRTAINVLGDAFGAGIVHHLSRKDLESLDKANHSQTLDRGKILVPSASERDYLSSDAEDQTIWSRVSTVGWKQNSHSKPPDLNYPSATQTEEPCYDNIKEKHALLSESSKLRNYKGTENSGFVNNESGV